MFKCKKNVGMSNWKKQVCESIAQNSFKILKIKSILLNSKIKADGSCTKLEDFIMI